jgi:hypothetical protein
MLVAMLCAAAVTAEFVGGKATRDALFLTTLPVTALPAMVIGTSIFSILLVAAQGWGTRRVAPATLVPVLFVASAALHLAEWTFRGQAPIATSILVYLHVSGAGPLLASGFWLIASEQFDPRTARRHFGRIAGAGTLGGLCGAILSERAAAMGGGPNMLLFLALSQLATAWLVRFLAVSVDPAARTASVRDGQPASALPLHSGVSVIANAPHLRNLAALVLLGTTSAALLDYVFKVRAVETFGGGDGLLRFFALYYAVTSLVSFFLQFGASRAVLQRFGVALTTSTPSIALLAGAAGNLIAPGFASLLVARSGESIFRASWYRSGYELFYTPLPAAEKRAAKSIIDVAVDRLGDAVGGGFIRLVILIVPAAQSSVIVGLAMATAVGAIVVASRLNRWYVRTLENSLVNQGGGAGFEDVGDGSTAIVLRSIQARAATSPSLRSAAEAAETQDAVVRDIITLRTGSRDAVIKILGRLEGMNGALVPHVIPLLAVEPVADFALFALRKVAEEHVGMLTDALLDPGRDYAVRRRLARVFSISVSQRAADALLLALDDSRFDVRFQSARSLAAIADRNPRVRIDRDRVIEVVLREVAVGRPVWESRRLLDEAANESPLDVFVRDRAGQSLGHVFTLLSLVLPREPLQIAFRSLQSDDRHLRGTALEYLEEVLPPRVRAGLWPFIATRRPAAAATPAAGLRSGQAGHDAVMANLLRASESVTLHGIAKDWDNTTAAGFSPH